MVIKIDPSIKPVMIKNNKLTLSKIDKIFIDLFKLKGKNLTKVDIFSCLNWDSLNHAKLMNIIEKKFKIKISTKNYINLISYKVICSFLIKSLK